MIFLFLLPKITSTHTNTGNSTLGVLVTILASKDEELYVSACVVSTIWTRYPERGGDCTGFREERKVFDYPCPIWLFGLSSSAIIITTDDLI